MLTHVQIIDAFTSAGPAAGPSTAQSSQSTAQSGRSTARTPHTVSELHAQHVQFERRFKKIRGTMMNLRRELAEARRINNELNDRLHKIDLVMENIVTNFLNIDTI
jgi:hypothetical protein